MHIELIGKSTVKVALSEDDLNEYGLEFDIIESGSAATRRLLSDILDRLLLTKNIDLTSEKLYIEVFPGRPGGVLMYISNSKGVSLSDRETENADEIIEAVFSENTIPQLVSTAAGLDLRIGQYIKSSSLYCSDTSFELIIGLDRREIIKTLKKLRTCQDAVLSGGSGIRAAHIREHCTPILTECAIKRLSSLQSML